MYAYGGALQIFDCGPDRFVFPGYERRVALHNTGDPQAPTDGVASLTDTYPLAPFDERLDGTARFLRYGKAGRTVTSRP